jgi:hypothetical protein
VPPSPYDRWDPFRMPALLPVQALSLCVGAAVLAGSLAGFAFSSPQAPEPPRRAVAETMRPPLPAGSTARGAVGVEATAIRLAAALDAVPLSEGGDEASRFCRTDRLRVRWVAPLEGEFTVGGHVSPVGPAPAPETEQVNGLVVCEGESYAYMGFEARWDGAAWGVAAIPSLSDEHELHEELEPAEPDEHSEPAHAEPAQEQAAATPVAPRPAAPRRPTARGFSIPSLGSIEGYASYDPQRVCDPTAKPGTTALKNLLMGTYAGTRNLGVSRTCTARGVSEHKEGRAFDWGVDVGVPRERAAAEGLMAQLLATDAAGNRHALARRLGIMYVIWDQRIWSAYSASRGWRAYGGANPHTDHVHISLSWAGAMGRTSYWQGSNADLLTFDRDLKLVDAAPAGAPSRLGGTASSTGTHEERASRRREDEDEHEPVRAGRRERESVRQDDDDRREQADDAHLQAPVDPAVLAEQRAEREARKAAQRAEREARKAAQRAEREARKAAQRTQEQQAQQVAQQHAAQQHAAQQQAQAAQQAARQQARQARQAARAAAQQQAKAAQQVRKKAARAQRAVEGTRAGKAAGAAKKSHNKPVKAAGKAGGNKPGKVAGKGGGKGRG